MPAAGPKRHPSADNTARWGRLLSSNSSLVIPWVRQLAAHQLINNVNSGDPTAAAALAAAYRPDLPPSVSEIIRNILLSITQSKLITAVWQVWSDSRSEQLLDILRQINRPASGSPELQVLSLIILNQQKQLHNLDPKFMDGLVSAINDRDPRIADMAKQVALAFQETNQINALGERWLTSRSPRLEEILKSHNVLPSSPPAVWLLTRLKFGDLESVRRLPVEAVPALISAQNDLDAEIRSRASACLVSISNQDSIDEVCAIWVSTRKKQLAEVIHQGNYLASHPWPVRLRTALLTTRPDIVRQTSASDIPALLEACNDPDSEIAKLAQACAGELVDPDARAALCQRWIDYADPIAREIALKAGYLPEDASQRATFLFLTGQYQLCQQLDFNLSLLRSVYENGSAELRSRLVQTVQESGRSEYLAIFSQPERQSSLQLSTEETLVSARVHLENQQWARLWDILPGLPPQQAFVYFQAIHASGWQPDSELDRQEYTAMQSLMQSKAIFNRSDLIKILPPAVPQAVLKISSRVNDICFSPTEPEIAIVTSNPRLVVWNFHEARIQKTVNGFQHALSRVLWLPEGPILCAERSNTAKPCGVYCITDSSAYCLGHHSGSVTALESSRNGQFITAGRDGKVIFWDKTTFKQVNSAQVEDWPRNLILSRDHQSVLLLNRSITLLSQSNLSSPQTISLVPYSRSGVSKSIPHTASFVPNSDSFLVGQNNGQIIHYTQPNNSSSYRRKVLLSHPGSIQGIHFLEDRNLLITAGAEGVIKFSHWSDLAPMGAATIPDQQITSMHISPSGDFMATGTSKARMVLWDLRISQIPDILDKSACATSLSEFSTLSELSDLAALPENVRSALQFQNILLRRRYRFDIQIEKTKGIQPGEFDVVIE